MKKILSIALALAFVVTASAQPQGGAHQGRPQNGTPEVAERGQRAQPGQRPFFEAPKLPDNVVYSVRAGWGSGDAYGRSSNNAPTFFIYTDKAVDEEGGKALVEELGMQEVMDVHHGSVYVINPVGAKYDAAKDFEAFKEVFNSTRTGNLKVIGLGAGASFVNATLAPQACGYIAGILTYGGKAAKVAKGDYAGVPAYVAGKTAKSVAAGYNTINASLKDAEPLLTVTVNPAELSKADLFADAWKQTLCKTYRYNNYKHTHYEGGEYGKYGVYELEPYTIWEDLDITRIVVEEKPMGGFPGMNTGDQLPTLWYEYWPNELMDATKVPAQSVPVMVLLHGNANDPRTQAETSGFIEVAGKERFFVVEMEWQGSRTAAAMGHDGIETTVYKLLAKYPQLDPSRVYAEGLSAGSMTATALGIRKPFVFTAVGGHSGAIFGGRGASIYSNYDSFSNAALQMRGNVEMPYFSIACTADTTVGFLTPDNWKDNCYLNAWNIYETINDLPVVDELDFSVDPVFGMKLDNRHTVTTVKGEGIKMEVGDLTKAGVPLIRCVAVIDYGHWNFKPTAQMMWDFFKQFSRDPETKKLSYHGEKCIDHAGYATNNTEGMNTVYEFLKNCGTYYIATAEGDQPRVRPFGTILEYEGKLYIQTGHVKNVAKQIAANPKVEICAFNGSEWIRLSGTLVDDPRVEPKKAMLDANPDLRGMYDENDDNTAVYYFKDATATINSFTAPQKEIKF